MKVDLTPRHAAYQHALRDKDHLPVIAVGPAGTSKTYSAVEAAAEWLSDKRKRVMVTRPNVSFAKELGFIPGTEREKLGPWIKPVEQAFVLNGIKPGELSDAEKQGRLQYIALEHLQGLTFDDTFMIVDECENMTLGQLKVLLTRTGRYSKLVLCGDVAQTSERFKNSGLAELLRMVKELDVPCHTIEFTFDDIVRSQQCKEWLLAFHKWENK